MSATTVSRSASLAAQARMLRRLAPILIGNVGLPYVVYLIVHALGVADVPALAFSAIPPAVLTIVTALRTRRIDVIGALSLGVIAVGIAASFLTGNGQFAVAKDSLFGLALGIAAVVSLVAGRPLLYQLMRVFRGTGDPAGARALERAWETDAAFRTMVRRYTAVWAVALLVIVALKLIIAFSLPVGTSLPLLQFLDPVLWIGLITLTRKGLRPHRATLAAA